MARLVPRSLLATAAAVAALLGGAASSASALVYLPAGDECALSRNPLFTPWGEALVDSAGYAIGVGDSGYATIWDGGLGGASAGDAWNGFGQLYVGAAPNASTMYVDSNPHGCHRTAAGDGVAFPTVDINGLQVQRSLLVPAVSGTGVRLLDAVTNPTSEPVTTSVWVGDLRAGHAVGVGSDDATTIRSTSSGDAVLSTADRWAVTTDTRTGGLLPSDPAVAHIWGGPGAANPATIVRSGAQAGDVPIDDPTSTLEKKQFGWGWQQVTLAPGETARFLSWEIPRQTSSRSWVDQAPLAQTAAQNLLTAPLSTRYQGLTPAEIATVRNWAPPAVDGGIAGVPGATTIADTTLHAVGVDYGSAQLAGCDAGTLSWDLGDGAHATGSTVTHRFAAGTAHVSLTIRGACGGSVTRSLSFSVVAPPEPTPTPAPSPPSTPTPAPPVPADDRGSGPREATDDDAPRRDGPTLKLFAPPSVKTTTLASAHGLVVGLQASVDGDVRLVLTGQGVKSVKTAAVTAGVTSFVKVQLDKSARPTALTLKSIKLRAKLTPRDGSELIQELALKLRR